MNLTGEIVKHKKFGFGTIVESKNDYITVMFHETKEQKKFLYPEAIGEFLELQNKLYSDNKDQAVHEIEAGHNGEREQRRINDIRGTIKRVELV